VDRTYGLDRGKVFPAEHARSLLNPARRLVQSPRRTVAAIGLEQTDHVLEVGSGPGFFSPSIAAAVPQGMSVTFDLQPEMLAIARERVGARGRFVQGDGRILPFANASFDCIFVATVLGELPDRTALVTDAHRILRSGGTLAIAETRRDSDFIAIAELRELVEPNGFRFGGRRGMRWQYVAKFERLST